MGQPDLPKIQIRLLPFLHQCPFNEVHAATAMTIITHVFHRTHPMDSVRLPVEAPLAVAVPFRCSMPTLCTNAPFKTHILAEHNVMFALVALKRRHVG